MATILPFRAIRPNPAFIDQLVPTGRQTESVAGIGMPPLKDLLETPARSRPETPEGQANAYGDIKRTLEELLNRNLLIKEDAACLYIYEVTGIDGTQTGIWAATPITELAAIKTHELTFSDSVRRLRNYREQTGLEGSPVLLTYTPNTQVNRLITHIKATSKQSTTGNSQSVHRIWHTCDPELIRRLADAFKSVGPVYLADGHHRTESAMRLPEMETISTLYMATDQLRIGEFHRVVIPDVSFNKTRLKRELAANFKTTPVSPNLPVLPETAHRMGMIAGGRWYSLTPRAHTYTGKTTAQMLDAAILQEYVFNKIFCITNPTTDPRLRCAGSASALVQMETIIDQNPGAVGFTLSPLTTGHLLAVADAGETLPPKSTWINPKIPYGLLLHRQLTQIHY